MIITRNNEYVEWNGTEEEFNITTLPVKGWSIYTGTYPIPQPKPTQDEILASLISVLEIEYDIVAKEKRYDSRYTCALRAGYQGPFQQQGIIFAQWMDNCNTKGYEIMSDVLLGTREIPTPEELTTEIFTQFPKPW